MDDTKLTMTPLNSSVNTEYIGSQTRLSSGDIQSLNKAYSCAGRVYTNGGGNRQVLYSFLKGNWSQDGLGLNKGCERVLKLSDAPALEFFFIFLR